MSGTRAWGCPLFFAACVASACSDVYGPADVQLKVNSAQAADEHFALEAQVGTIGLFEGASFPITIQAYRIVDASESRIEQVVTVESPLGTIQTMPGILVQLYFDYFFVADCSLYPQAESYRTDGEYWEIIQVGADSGDCSIKLPADDLAGQTSSGERPSCVLIGVGPEDNGKPFLARTGPNGMISLILRFKDDDPTTLVEGLFFRLVAVAGSSVAELQAPSDSSTICAASTTTG